MFFPVLSRGPLVHLPLQAAMDIFAKTLTMTQPPTEKSYHALIDFFTHSSLQMAFALQYEIPHSQKTIWALKILKTLLYDTIGFGVCPKIFMDMHSFSWLDFLPFVIADLQEEDWKIRKAHIVVLLMQLPHSRFLPPELNGLFRIKHSSILPICIRIHTDSAQQRLLQLRMMQAQSLFCLGRPAFIGGRRRARNQPIGHDMVCISEQQIWTSCWACWQYLQSLPPPQPQQMKGIQSYTQEWSLEYWNVEMNFVAWTSKLMRFFLVTPVLAARPLARIGKPSGRAMCATSSARRPWWWALLKAA